MKQLAIVVGLLLAVASASFGKTADLVSPQGVALDKAGHVLVTCQGASNCVTVMTRAGETVTEFGSDRLVSPSGIAVDPDGRIIVANSGKNEIDIFDPNGKFLVSATGLANPQDVAVASDGLIYVADTGNGRIAVFDLTGEKIAFSVTKIDAGSGPANLVNPSGIAVSNTTLAISDTGNKRILLIPRPTKASAVFRSAVIEPFGIEPMSLALDSKGRVYVVDRRTVRAYDQDGKSLGVYSGKTTSWFDPGMHQMGQNGSILVVDRSSYRVLVTNPKLFDVVPTLKLDAKDTSKAVIEWTSALKQPTILRYGTTESCDQRIEDKRPTTKHRVTLTGLKPATRYYYHVYAPVEAIPLTCRQRTDLALDVQNKAWNILAEGYTPEYAFASMPEAGKTDWVYAPSIVLVYKHVTYPPGADGKKPEDRILDDDDMAVLRHEMETYRTWAWQHSHCKLNFAWTWVVVDEPRDAGQLGDVTETVFADIKKGVEAQGEDLKDFWYADVVGVHGWYALYLAGTVAGSAYELGSCYTGFGHGSKPGWWWFPTHEHGHLLHSWLMCSGVSTFGYPDAPWTLKGQFGEDFSFLAYNYRVQPPSAWLTLKKSVIEESPDANANGVPDDDPRVPLDEKRFGWTAEMGGDCMKRLVAGVRTPGYPGDTDTDFDGKVHKLNEGELYWVDRKIPESTVVLDGKMEPKEWTEFYSIPNMTTPAAQREIKAKLYISWDDKNYYFAAKSSKEVVCGFDLDAANDGWFHGRDNLRFSVRPPMDGTPLEASGQIWDFLNDQINGDLWYRDAYKPGDIKAATGEQDGWYVTECAVPARPDVRIAPHEGAQFGLRASLSIESKDSPTSVGFFDGEDFVYDITCIGK